MVRWFLLVSLLLLGSCRHTPKILESVLVREVPILVPTTEYRGDREQLPSVFFDFDQAVVRSDGTQIKQQLDSLGSYKQVVLSGLCDPRGSKVYNDLLGFQRAKAVQQLLIQLGVSEAKLSLRSYGESLAIGTDEASWQHDRRVDIEVFE